MSDSEMAERLELTVAPKRKKRSRKWLWIIAIVAAGLAGWWWFFGARPGFGYVTQKVTRGPLVIAVSATGTLTPRDQVDVGAEVSGRIDDLYVDYNDHVTKGEKLAKINTDQLAAQLGQARATLDQAQATLVQNEATFKRDKALLKSKALSQQQYDTAQGDYLRAKAGVSLAAAQVQQFETQISKATVYSPIDGVVLDRKVSRGQTVVAAMTTPVLFTLASDLSRMELDVDIDEADVGSVHAGQPAMFTVDAYPTLNFAATLVTVRNAPQTTNGVVTYKGVLMVNNPRLLLKPGMTATAEITTGEVDDALLVPNAALRFVPSEFVVRNAPPAPLGVNRGRIWMQSGGTLKPRDLTLGGTNGRLTQVLGGDLKANDAVVTEEKTQGSQ